MAFPSLISVPPVGPITCGAPNEFGIGALVDVGWVPVVGLAVAAGFGVLGTGVFTTLRTAGVALAGGAGVGLFRPIGVKVASGVIVGSRTVVASSVGCAVAVTTTKTTPSVSVGLTVGVAEADEHPALAIATANPMNNNAAVDLVMVVALSRVPLLDVQGDGPGPCSRSTRDCRPKRLEVVVVKPS